MSRVKVEKPWVEPNLRSSGATPRESVATLFLSDSGLASFMLSFVLVLSLALLIAS